MAGVGNGGVSGARAVLGRLTRSPLLAKLRALHLTGGQAADDGAEALARTPLLSRLTRLNVANQCKGWSPGLRGQPYPIQPAQQRALVERFGPEACAF